MSKEHSSSIIFSVVSLIGSFIIILITVLKQYVAFQSIDIITVIKAGDVYIICASMAITAIYNFHTYKTEITNGWPTIFFWVSILNYTISLIFYFLISIANKSMDNFFLYTAIIVFAINMVITYLSAYFQNINIDVISSRQAQRSSLQTKFAESMGVK